MLSLADDALVHCWKVVIDERSKVGKELAFRLEVFYVFCGLQDV